MFPCARSSTGHAERYRLAKAFPVSATNLSLFFECEHWAALEVGVASGLLSRPGRNEIEKRMLERRGLEHERRVLDGFDKQGLEVCEIPRAPGNEKQQAAQTLEQMRVGTEVIYQGTLQHGDTYHRPDFLLRTGTANHLGPFSYEAVDAKLSREVKARAILQLCTYTEAIAAVQTVTPTHFWIAGGGDAGALRRLRANDFMAYYRLAKQRLRSFLEAQDPETYPEPVDYCDVCAWWKRCEEERRDDDHLSLVAGISRTQRNQLAESGVTTVVDLSRLGLAERVGRIGPDALVRIREQARVQVEGRTGGPRYELLGPDPGQGLERLPEPSSGDLFLDIEGDAFVQGDGLEYLFGLLQLGGEEDPFSFEPSSNEPRYTPYWAETRSAEKRAFENVVDAITRLRGEFPGLHVFHFGHRENDALKKLSLRHSTRAEEVDALLRGGVLVDLHRVVRQALRASVESYTLKELEVFHEFERSTGLRDAARAMQLYGWWLETGDDADANAAELRTTIQAYNEEDCQSTRRLRDWLESLRSEAAKAVGRALGRPEERESAASVAVSTAARETAELAARLVEGLPSDTERDNQDGRARRLLADLLDWHRREEKSGWWEHFRTLELAPDELVEDRATIGRAEYVGPCGKEKRSVLHRYEFPQQEHSIRAKSHAIEPTTKKTLTVEDVGPDFVVLKCGRTRNAPEVQSLVPGEPVKTSNHRERLMELGHRVVAHGLDGRGQHSAALHLLGRAAPQCGQPAGASLMEEGEEPAKACIRLALAMRDTVLAVQGPPGSGKTYCAVRTICALLESGKRVGVTANSHKVIRQVLQQVAEQRGPAGVLHTGSADRAGASELFEVSDNYAEIARRLRSGDLILVGGTSWAWSRPEFSGTLDTLVIDEAGQVSLANALAVAGAARNLILFGDPAQLDQPQKGVHPPGADASALGHLLGDAPTMPSDSGLFISRTRRLHPDICRFTSEVFYEGRLESLKGLDRQEVLHAGVLSGSSLRWMPIDHRGNANRSDEEVAGIAGVVEELCDGRHEFVDSTGKARELGKDDVLIVAPYNAQVMALQRRLQGFRIGTVDKFQGQQAPVVLYSMTSSSAEDAPRGMDFLYNLNRLNVATSRAQALVILVGSPALVQARCRSPRQMKLVNALCRYLELAKALP